MGAVAVSLKVMPADANVNLENVKSEISKKMKLNDAKIEPIAFGLKQLRILIVIPDAGGTDKIEAEIRKIKGVGDVEVESVTLV